MKVCFLGTPDFAVESLMALHKYNKAQIIGVFTQPDKPQGRKKTITPPPVKVIAESFGYPVFQPNRIKEPQWVKKIRELQPDLLISAAFGQILSQEILDIPKKGTVNVHGSLLPKYRGPAPIQWSIIEGETMTGITTMLSDVGIDTGDMLLKREVAIDPQETAGELFHRLAKIGGEVLIQTLEQLDDIMPQKQDANQASYFPMIEKSMAKLDFNKTSEQVVNLVRGMNPWPVAFFDLEEKQIKVYRAKTAEGKGKPGEVLFWDPKKGILIATKNGAVELLELQAPGKKCMDGKNFVNGLKLPEGKVL